MKDTIASNMVIFLKKIGVDPKEVVARRVSSVYRSKDLKKK
jgi:hypothetical protein